MTRSRWYLGTLMVVALSATGTAFVFDRTVDDRQVITRLEGEWLNAYEATTLDRVLADDFVHPVATGQFLTKRQHIDWVVAHPPVSAHHARFERVEVRLFGAVAIATGIVVTEGVAPQPVRTIFTDVFARRQQRWQAINAQENDVVSFAGRGQ